MGYIIAKISVIGERQRRATSEEGAADVDDMLLRAAHW